MDRQNKPAMRRTKESGILVPGTPAMMDHARKVHQKQMETKLTVRQQMFVKEYIIDFNAQRAATAAGYSETTKKVIGYNLLQKQKVQDAIQKEMKKRAQRVEVKQDAVINELAALAFSDIRNHASWGAKGVKLRPSHTLTDFASSAIAEVSSVDTATGKNVKIKMYDKVRALELLARHLGMLADRVELDAKVVKSDEQKFHIVQEIISQPDVVERIRNNFRQRLGNDSGTGGL